MLQNDSPAAGLVLAFDAAARSDRENDSSLVAVTAWIRTRGMETIDMPAYLREIAESIVAPVATKTELSFSADQGWRMPPGRALPLGMIVGELVTNSVKFAHPTGVPGKIEIECLDRNDGGTTLIVSDDGVGLPDGLDPTATRRLGFYLIRTLAEQLGATVAFDSNLLGLAVRLGVPAA